MTTDAQLVAARNRAMNLFLAFSIAYFAIALWLSSVALPPNKDAIVSLFVTIKRLLPKAMYLVVGLGVVATAAMLLTRKFSIGQTLRLVIIGVIAGVLFQAAFTIIKSCLPGIIPFYADPFFLALDKALHFGTDPYVLTHQVAGTMNPELIDMIYFKIWGPPAGFLPIILCVLDNDVQRMRRSLILFATAWILFGNLFALMGMSVGPIFYDRVYGAEEFGGLVSALDASGISSSGIGWVQNMLWHFQTNDMDFVGPGISAFPSVHVAVATLYAIYLSERSRYLAPIGIGYLLAILFLSVHTGFHYAVDGYFSIALMVGAWALLKRYGDRMETPGDWVRAAQTEPDAVSS